MNTTAQELLAQIGIYWNLAYAAGVEGIKHDTKAGDEQRTWNEVLRLVKALAAAPALPAVDDAMKQRAGIYVLQTGLPINAEQLAGILNAALSGPTAHEEENNGQ